VRILDLLCDLRLRSIVGERRDGGYAKQWVGRDRTAQALSHTLRRKSTATEDDGRAMREVNANEEDRIRGMEEWRGGEGGGCCGDWAPETQWKWEGKTARGRRKRGEKRGGEAGGGETSETGVRVPRRKNKRVKEKKKQSNKSTSADEKAAKEERQREKRQRRKK